MTIKPTPLIKGGISPSFLSPPRSTFKSQHIFRIEIKQLNIIFYESTNALIQFLVAI